MDEAEGAVKVHWTKAHVEAKDVKKHNIGLKQIVGNECADALAKRGAAVAALDLNPRRQIGRIERKAKMVRNRLLFIQSHVIKQSIGEGREEEEEVEFAPDQATPGVRKFGK